jgi:hypothetical protein
MSYRPISGVPPDYIDKFDDFRYRIICFRPGRAMGKNLAAFNLFIDISER